MQDIQIKKNNFIFSTREAYKTLRSNIEFSGAGIKTIAITSCVQNEGKSTVSFETAMSFAENGGKTLLIDADLRKSIMREHFQSGHVRYGLSNYLIGKCSVDDCICKTQEENFYMIFSGPVTPNPSELLSGERFNELLAKASEEFDYVVVDLPPLGSVIDAAIVGKKCDGTVLVIADGQISYRFAQSVKRQLTKADCKILGVVLNKVDLGERSPYGHYGQYGKYYGKYYGNYTNEGNN